MVSKREELFNQEIEKFKAEVEKMFKVNQADFEERLNGLVEGLKKYSQKSDEEIIRNQAFYAGQYVEDQAHIINGLEDYAEGTKNSQKKEYYEAAIAKETMNLDDRRNNLDAKIKEELDRRDRLAKMSDDELRKEAMNVYGEDLGYTKNESVEFVINHDDVRDKKEKQFSHVTKVINQVIDVEVNDQKFISQLKGVIKAATRRGALTLGMFGGASFASSGLLYAIDGDAELFKWALMSTGVVGALGFAVGGTVEAIQRMDASIHYEENVRLLKEHGLYDYVSSVVEAKKEEMRREAEKVIELKYDQNNSMTYNVSDLEQYKNISEEGMAR